MKYSNQFSKFWGFSKDIIMLNHGSFGASPSAVLEKQNSYRKQMEHIPSHYFIREFQPLFAKARQRLAEFIGAPADDIAFVPNATAGVNGVLRSFDFKPGDEILATDFIYPACRNTLSYLAERFGVKINIVSIPFPVLSPDRILETIITAVTPKTRIALIEHISSSTAIIFPIKEIVAGLAKKGIETLVDGAHAPGMLDLNIADIAPAFYTGNCHKWICSPKGAAFLYVRKDFQNQIVPLSISNDFYDLNDAGSPRAGFRAAFDWTGTQDFTPYLCVPDSIDFIGSLTPGGWNEIRKRNNSLIQEAKKILAPVFGTGVSCADCTGSMLSIPINRDFGQFTGVHPLAEKLFHKYNIEAIIPRLPDRRYAVRLSAHLYNEISHYEALSDALKKEL